MPGADDSGGRRRGMRSGTLFSIERRDCLSTTRVLAQELRRPLQFRIMNLMDRASATTATPAHPDTIRIPFRWLLIGVTVVMVTLSTGAIVFTNYTHSVAAARTAAVDTFQSIYARMMLSARDLIEPLQLAVSIPLVNAAGPDGGAAHLESELLATLRWSRRVEEIEIRYDSGEFFEVGRIATDGARLDDVSPPPAAAKIFVRAVSLAGGAPMQTLPTSTARRPRCRAIKPRVSLSRRSRSRGTARPRRTRSASSCCRLRPTDRTDRRWCPSRGPSAGRGAASSSREPSCSACWTCSRGTPPPTATWHSCSTPSDGCSPPAASTTTA
jgi:hypothetical protein